MNDELLDTELSYQPDAHITAYDLNRFSAERMSEEEQKAFLYHIDECPACRAFVQAFLKKKD